MLRHNFYSVLTTLDESKTLNYCKETYYYFLMRRWKVHMRIEEEDEWEEGEDEEWEEEEW